MFKKKTTKKVATSSKETNSNDECFLKTINHPRKLQLATGLLNGESPESFYDDYGTVRVQEMLTLIDTYNENPEKYLKDHSVPGCLTCGR